MSDLAGARSQKSTNDRFKWRLVRQAFTALEVLGPRLGGWWAERMFFRPTRLSLTERQTALLARGESFFIPVAGRRLRAWRWGDGTRTVLLIHGWSGGAAHFAHFVGPLLEAGFAAVAFDAPAHGASPGRRTSAPEVAAAVRAAVDAVGPVYGLIAHSFAALAATLALRDGLPARRAVFVAPAGDPDVFALRFSERLGLGPATVRALKARSERRLGLRWSELHLPTLARTMSVPLLAFHDHHDSEVPWCHAAEAVAAWPGAELVTTGGLSHGRILRDPGVVARSVAFLRGRDETRTDRSETGKEVTHAFS